MKPYAERAAAYHKKQQAPSKVKITGYGPNSSAYGGNIKLPSSPPSPGSATSETPTTSAAPSPTGVAHDSIYNAEADRAERIRTGAEGDLTYGLTRGANAYGLRATVNPDQTFSVAEVDPKSPDYNPFNQMAMLRKHFDQTQKGNTNSYAARGQIYAGSLQNAKDATREGYNQDQAGLTGAFGDYIRGLITNKRTAGDSADEILAGAGASETERKIENAAPDYGVPSSGSGLKPTSTVGPRLDAEGDAVKLTPLQRAAALATKSSPGSQQAMALWQRALKDPGLAKQLLKKLNKTTGGGAVTTA